MSGLSTDKSYFKLLSALSAVKTISVCRSTPDEGSFFYSPDISRSPNEVLHHGHTGGHDNHQQNPIYDLIDGGSFGSSFNLTEIHQQGLVDDKPVSEFAATGTVRRAYNDDKLCDYIVAHGFDVDGVGNRIEKPEATIPYAYTLEMADKRPFKSNSEPIYPQTVVCIGDHGQEMYEILQTSRVRPTNAFISLEGSLGAWNKVDFEPQHIWQPKNFVCDIFRYHLEDLTEETLNKILSFGTIEFVNITHPAYSPDTIYDRNAHIIMSTLQALRIKRVFPQVQVYNGKTIFQDHSPAQVQNLIDMCNKLLLGYLEGSHKIGSGSLALLYRVVYVHDVFGSISE
jgi:hypothetical protein